MPGSAGTLPGRPRHLSLYDQVGEISVDGPNSARRLFRLGGKSVILVNRRFGWNFRARRWACEKPGRNSIFAAGGRMGC